MASDPECAPFIKEYALDEARTRSRLRLAGQDTPSPRLAPLLRCPLHAGSLPACLRICYTA